MADDPSYGAEPMLRAETVTAYLRLSSLWRGRLEIGTLALDNPSLNLVRRADGHWNLEELVRAHLASSLGSNCEKQSGVAASLPLRRGQGRTHQLQTRPGEEGLRVLRCRLRPVAGVGERMGCPAGSRPMRSDVPVSDTGMLRMEGRFQRASSLRDTPLNLKIDFTKGQLGQITALIYGRDRGWRGGVTSAATLTGTPAALAVTHGCASG